MVDLRELLWNTASRDCGDDLLPDKSSETEEDAPDPLLKRQRSRRKSYASKLNYDDLKQHFNVKASWHTKDMSSIWKETPDWARGLEKNDCEAYLADERCDPYDVVDWVREQADKHVSLAVDFSCVDFVE